MFNTLRNRLLASYGALLLVMLALIGSTLLVFLRSRPLPTDEIVRDLTATLLDVRVTEDWQLDPSALELDWGSLTDSTADSALGAIQLRVTTYLADQSEARDVRTLVIDGEGRVQFDSAGTFAANDPVPRLDQQPLISARTARPMLSQVFQGTFANPDGAEWIYVAQTFQPLLGFMRSAIQMGHRSGMMSDQSPDEQMLLLVAEPVPHPSLREVFRLFGDDFFRPLARAGGLGLLIALGLAFVIARSVARPLQHMSRAAQGIAEGHFDQRVPVRGPQEVRALAASFNEMAARVSATQQAQRDFLANVSHDLRTPLTSIQGFSQAIAEGVASDPQAAQRAALVIHDEAGRLHRMVESLLDMARIEAGQPDMLRQTVQLGDILRVVGESLSVKARDKGVGLAVDVPPDLPRIAGDGDRLAQVFTNLLDNAFRHTPSGGSVTLSAAPDPGGEIVATVRDTGEGIPAGDLARIFERFYQVDKSRQGRRSGTGLGLAIARQIVEAHGGTIEAASALGQGTTFTVRLPAAYPHSAGRVKSV